MQQGTFGAPPQMNPLGYGGGQPAFAPAQVACPRCGQLASFYAQANRWGCDRCQMPVDPLVFKSGSEARNDTGVVVAKVIGCIVAIIVLTAIRVALH